MTAWLKHVFLDDTNHEVKMICTIACGCLPMLAFLGQSFINNVFLLVSPIESSEMAASLTHLV